MQWIELSAGPGMSQSRRYVPPAQAERLFFCKSLAATPLPDPIYGDPNRLQQYSGTF